MRRLEDEELKTLSQINFWCQACKHRWTAEPDPSRISDNPDTPWHPWSYSAVCEACGAEAVQAAWERNLLKAHAHATGPRQGAPHNLFANATPEQKARWRFNGLKHGLFSKTALFFPAKPGKYPQCERCEYRYNGCGQGDFYACALKAELFQRHRMALETRDPSLLSTLRADMQANLTGLLDDMILAVARTGVELKTPEWTTDKDGNVIIARYLDDEDGQIKTIFKLREHPLIARIFEAVQKNALSLADMGLTPKAQEDADIMRGNLAVETAETESALEYQRRQTEALENLQVLIARSREKVKTDPVLVAHQMQEREDGPNE